MKKIELVLFLGLGLVLTGHAVITPMLMVLLLVAGDFPAMSIATDRATPSPKPDVWRIRSVTIAAVILGLCELAFSIAVLAVGWSVLQLGPEALRTLAFVTLLLGGQAALCVVRERGHLWMSRPSPWLITASLVDVGLALVLAGTGLLMAPLPLAVILGVLAATVLFTLVLDGVKSHLIGQLTVA